MGLKKIGFFYPSATWLLVRGKLTSGRQEDFDGRVLQQVPPGEDGPDLGEVPLAMQMVTVAQNLRVEKKTQF